jgi:glycosyltransferase involved in cell wall biosynthesis
MAGGISSRVTIGIPVHNGERHVRASIESVLGQTFTDLQLVIADNASTDATGEICKEYAVADDRVVLWRNPDDLGARRNFHLVFERSQPSEFFKWHGHDDVLEPTFLERCVEHLDGHPTAVLCATGIRMIDGDDRDLGPGPKTIAFCAPTPHERLRAFYAHPRAHQTLFGVWRRRALAATDLLGPWYSSDRALLMELALQGCFARIDETLFVHREHRGRGDYVEDKVRWYIPERGGRPETSYWPHLRTTVETLATAPIPVAERALCSVELARRSRAVMSTWAWMLPRETVTSAVAGVRRHLPGRDDGSI